MNIKNWEQFNEGMFGDVQDFFTGKGQLDRETQKSLQAFIEDENSSYIHLHTDDSIENQEDNLGHDLIKELLEYSDYKSVYYSGNGAKFIVIYKRNGTHQLGGQQLVMGSRVGKEVSIENNVSISENEYNDLKDGIVKQRNSKAKASRESERDSKQRNIRSFVAPESQID